MTTFHILYTPCIFAMKMREFPSAVIHPLTLGLCKRGLQFSLEVVIFINREEGGNISGSFVKKFDPLHSNNEKISDAI